MFIVIFTKDSPERLRPCLAFFKNSEFQVYLMDDSVRSDNILINRNLAKVNSVTYHGLPEQQNLVKESMLHLPEDFISLGSGTWNLGNNRNYAMLLAKCRGENTVLMIDDDIRFINSNAVALLNEANATHAICNAEISGMADDSIVGHIFRSNGIAQKRFSSGGCMSIDLSKVTHFFVNEYNEDWIWTYMQNNGAPGFVPIIVEHQKYDPFINPFQKITFQETGEILWEGISLCSQMEMSSKLTDFKFWTNVCTARRHQITRLLEFSIPSKPFCKKVMEHLHSIHDNIDPANFSEFWSKYFKSRDKWVDIFNHLKTVRL